MSQPAYIDQHLTGISNAFMNDDEDFIAERVFPVVKVPKKTFKVAGYTKESLRIPSSSVRTGEAKARRVSLGRTEDDYGPLHEHSLSDFVTHDDMTMTDDPYDALGDAVENIMQKLMLIDEKDLATTLQNTSIITNNVTLAGTDQWSDYTNSTPFEDIKTAAIAMKASTLKIPNTLITSWEAWIQMVDHPDFLDRIKWSQTGVMTEADFIKLFAPYGIKNVIIGKVSENTAVEGQTDSLSAVWGKNVWLAYITDKPGRKTINGGYKFVLEEGREATREAFNNPRGEEVLVRDYYDYELLNADCFYLIKNVVA